MEVSDGRKYGAIFGGALVAAGLVLATVVFPFWNLVREDVYEEALVLSNEGGICYVETSDDIPKTVQECSAQPGQTVAVRFGEGLAWAVILDGPDGGGPPAGEGGAGGPPAE